MPVGLHKPTVQWYYTYLFHPDINWTELTLRQHFTFKNLRETVLKVCGTWVVPFKVCPDYEKGANLL